MFFATSISMVLGKKCSECKALYLRCLYVIVLDSPEGLCNDGARVNNRSTMRTCGLMVSVIHLGCRVLVLQVGN